MKINASRIQNDLDQLEGMGRLPQGGMTRLALSAEDMQAREYLIQSMKKAGLTVTIDAVGNIFGRRPGRQELAPVLIGSHLDTVPEGGNFDGVVGVIGALEVIRALNDAQMETERPIEMVSFTAEESSRFRTSTIGSKALKGALTIEQLKQMVDKDGISFYQALVRAGYEPDQLATAKRNSNDYHAFIELHIEQGPVLENLEKEIGIVTAIAAPTRMRITIQGRADHSGTTPMEMRLDALTAGAEIVLAIEEIAKKKAGPHTVGTVGDISVKPGAMNVVPGEVVLLVDIRDIDAADKAKAVRFVKEKIVQVAAERKVKIESDILSDEKPVQLAPKMIELIQQKAEKLQYSNHIMHSGAGHDAMNLVGLTDVGMIFIPCRDGISHNIEEYTCIEAIEKGADVLLQSVYRLAMETDQA